MYDGENYDDVIRQMEAFGVVWRNNELNNGLKIGSGRKTCGKGGKFWYRLHLFHPDNSSRRFIVGSFGRYGKGSEKVEWDREGLSAETLERYRREQAESRERERIQREEEARIAALSAADLWREASREGSSDYLVRKGVEPEACKFMPDGSILIPLLRYDWPRERALRGLQRIYPGPRKHRRTGEELPQKTFTPGFAKAGACLRLGDVDAYTPLILVGEGYATCLSIRMAIERSAPVFVALDAYNLTHVVEILRFLYPAARLLICADDDWQTKDHEGPNPGRRTARKVAKATERCEICWPVFAPATRQPKDTDFNDLHLRQGLPAVARQLGGVMRAILEVPRV